MAYAGKTVQNPATGQSIRFIVTSQDSAGRVLEMESSYERRGPEPPAHFHPSQEERFEVLEGELRVRLDGQLRTLRTGEQLHIAPGQVHAMWNPSEDRTTVRWTTTPALRTEEFMESMFGLAQDGRVNAQGAPGLLHVAVLADEFAPEFRLANPPRWVQKVVFGVLRPLAQLAGVPPLVHQYVERRNSQPV
ncbi:cupin domain-containing protein [Hymenobacter busanensis]|uniref:Cupin domain-containing protein n=1 Tax=Hymenobacter busanensis TaxID=2607656 RepID=A0A7L4ZVP2_9BACT|nr:cupin domain-containing protein [Hymenobacter busanensis]KAA9339333.1 cupin domain-containing protein [Hymenobacter busanensis]QHJ06905.1 cupin domain-containing protein [Hymenobacter busanensis]